MSARTRKRTGSRSTQRAPMDIYSPEGLQELQRRCEKMKQQCEALTPVVLQLADELAAERLLQAKLRGVRS